MLDNEAKPFVVFGYGRASRDTQVLSTEQQKSVVHDAFLERRRRLESWKYAVWGEFYADGNDDHASRDSILRERNNGSLLLTACMTNPGACIVVTKFDRIFANVGDVWDTLEFMDQHKIRLVILDFGGMELDTSTPIGKTFFVFMAQIKWLEVQDIRSRTKDAIAYRKRIGRCHNKPCIGWKHVVVRVPGIPNPQRYAVHDNQARRLARELLALKEKYGRGYDQMAQMCNTVLNIRQRDGRRWTHDTFKKWCKAAADGFPMSNGQLEAAPIPAGSQPVEISTISPDD